MTITQRQFSQLQAMGINLWQLKENGNKEQIPETGFLDIKLTYLLEMPFFIDVITSLGLSVGEVSCEKNKLSLGLLTWQFSPQVEISIDEHNHLITPPLSTIKSSSKLKRSLWNKLQEHTLS